MTTILRRLLGVVLVLTGLAGLVVGAWFARALGTDGAATFTARPPAGVPVVVDAQTNARTDIPLLITAGADEDVPVTVSIASPTDAKAFLADSEYARVTGIDVRDWALTTERLGTGDPIAPAAADLWRSQVTTNGTAEIPGDLEAAPETMIITVPEDAELSELTMTWTNPAWFYQALALAFAGLLVALVGLAVTLKPAVAPERGSRGTRAARGTRATRGTTAPAAGAPTQPGAADEPGAVPTEEAAR